MSTQPLDLSERKNKQKLTGYIAGVIVVAGVLCRFIIKY